MEKNQNQMSLFSAILTNINVMVGAGIFIIPALMAQKAFSISFLGWAFVGIVFLPIVWSISQITKYFPGQNSFYNYSKKGINKSAGFISGWLYFLGYASSAAILVLALQDILASQLNLGIIKEFTISFDAVFIVLFCLLNLLSVSVISKILNSVTLFKLLPIIIAIILTPFYYNSSLTFDFGNVSSLAYTLPLALFGFWGFESSTNISHLIKGDKRNAARAILIGFIATVIIYTFFNFAVLHIMNIDNLMTYQASSFVNFLNIANPLVIGILKILITTAIMTAYASATFGIIFADSANLHSMATENLLPLSSKIKKTSSNGRPIYSIWILGLATFVLAAFVNSKEILTGICNLGILTSFALTLVSLLMIQLEKKEKLTQIIPTILAFFSFSALFYYSWILLGNDNMTRFMYASPLLVLAIVGFIMFKLQENIFNK